MAKIENRELRWRALDRQIDGLKTAIERARSACLMGNLIAFIAAAALFNGLGSWNYGQMNRRAELARLADGLPNNEVIDLEKLPEWLQKGLADEEGDLSYMKHLFELQNKDDEVESSTRITLQEISKHELKELIKRRISFDTLSLPVIGVDFTLSDVGIIGGFGLMIVGFWLLGSLRKQHLALQEFVVSPDGGHFQVTDNYEAQESIYAYKSISNAPVFSVSQGDPVVDIITNWMFFFPPGVFLANHLLTAIHLYSRALGVYTHWHAVLEGVVWLGLAYIWFKAWRYERRTQRAVSAWAHNVRNTGEAKEQAKR